MCWFFSKEVLFLSRFLPSLLIIACIRTSLRRWPALESKDLNLVIITNTKSRPSYSIVKRRSNHITQLNIRYCLSYFI
jgi:hypothetical protein